MASSDTKRKKAPEFTSPIGTFRYPKITEPDYGNDKFPKPDGEYSVQLILSKDDPATKAFLALIQPVFDAAVAEGQEAFDQLPIATRKKLKSPTINSFCEDLYDKETEEPTGDIVIKTKLKASGVYKSGPNAGKAWSARPVVYDARGNRLSPVPAIWGGTRGRIAFSASPYFIPGTGMAGLGLRLIGAKIISLVSAGERTADSLGFGGAEDGYVADLTNTSDATQHVADALGDDNIPF